MNVIAICLMTTFYILSGSHACPIKNKDGLEERDIIYTGKHDIVKIYSSVYLLYKQQDRVKNRIVFFAEADTNSDGSKVDKGLYVMIDNSTTKLLDNANDIAGDGTGKVFFATNDGVYAYNPEEGRAYKYGHLEEKIISLAAENNTGVIYALTDNHIMYKITGNGNKSDVDDRVKYARGIFIDWFDNLYYYDDDRNLYVVGDKDAKKITGLPDNPASIKPMIKPPDEEAIAFLLNDVVLYNVYSNGTTTISQDSASLRSKLLTHIKPTAYSFDLYLVVYFAHDKKIYEINVVTKILDDIFCNH
ncbi:hypothetical protein ABMA27_000880 [Loxostege sticticalis]|uniref:Ommochrome-binding protein n=1 Tax=Loxostege sticticalis TaxID=481309 RepID=A0ABR3I0R3_LOXSC